MIKVLFFGPVADRVRMREMQVEYTHGMTLHDVIAVNKQQVHDKQAALCDNNNIAFMAKFSGGWNEPGKINNPA
jgi:molybdopterin converting factor small subunit